MEFYCMPGGLTHYILSHIYLLKQGFKDSHPGLQPRSDYLNHAEKRAGPTVVILCA